MGLALGTKFNETLAELLFNLASADRLALLTEIAARRQNLTDLSKAINVSRPECSRHLTRLKKTRLIVKDSDGGMEEDFHALKDALLFPVMPIYHRLDPRIRAHVFMCVIGLLFYRYIQKKAERATGEDPNRKDGLPPAQDETRVHHPQGQQEDEVQAREDGR